MSRTRLAAACAALLTLAAAATAEHVAEGPAPLKKFRTGSFSLRAFDREKCVPTDFGANTGSCETTWSYKVNFRKHKH